MFRSADDCLALLATAAAAASALPVSSTVKLASSSVVMPSVLIIGPSLERRCGGILACESGADLAMAV